MPRPLRSSHQLLLFAPLLLILLPACGGGGQKDKITVYRYPDFYNPDLKTIAVLPFANRTADPAAGMRLSDKLSAVLTNNRTYEVYTRAHLADILAEKDLADAGIIDPDKAMEIGRLKSVQALICGATNRFEYTVQNETRYNAVPVYGRDGYGNLIITGWNQVPYIWTRHDGFCECQVVVIDTQTGRQIAAVHDPSNWYAEGSPPKYSPVDCLRYAEEDQVARLARSIAVTPTEIKLKGKVVRTATSLYDQKWEYQNKLAPTDEKLYIVVRLPADADRNNFRITIIKKGTREDLAKLDFVWSKQYETYGYEFKTTPILAAGGFGPYQAKLYSGPQPIAWADFELAPKR